jgi:hypothetical protein
MPNPQQDITVSQPVASTHDVEILVNTKPVSVPHVVSGAEVLTAAKVPPDFELFRVHGKREIAVAPDERIHVHHHEKFIASPSLDPAYAVGPAHAAAVETVRETFAGHTVDVEPLQDGVTVITVRGVDVGAGWNTKELDITVRLQVTFPSSPPYPYYASPGLSRTDGRAFSQVQPHVEVAGQIRTQISLQKPYDQTVETLGARLFAVVCWLRNPR